MKKPEVPCAECERRTAECHAVCEEWKVFESAQEEYRKWIHQKRKENGRIRYDWPSWMRQRLTGRK